MFKHLTLASCLAAGLTSTASAQVLIRKDMPLDIALELAQSAVQACSAEGYNVSAAAVDRAGVLRALLRAGNAGVHTPDATRRKAYTAASRRTPTSQMAKNEQANPDAAQLVGIGGAPGGNLDEACALAAIKQVEAKLH